MEGGGKREKGERRYVRGGDWREEGEGRRREGRRRRGKRRWEWWIKGGRRNGDGERRQRRGRGRMEIVCHDHHPLFPGDEHLYSHTMLLFRSYTF